MSEGNASGGLHRSRSVLGDLTNRIGKRGSSGRDKGGIDSVEFDDKDVVKRIRASPRPCTEINSLKGNVISGISKIPSKPRDLDVPCSGSDNIASKSSTDADDGGDCLKGQDGAMRNSKGHGSSKDIAMLDIGGRDVSRIPNNLNSTDNDTIDNYGKVDHLEDVTLPLMDKIGGRGNIDFNLIDIEGGRAANAIAAETDRCGESRSLQEDMSVGFSEVATESKCSRIGSFVREHVADHTIVGGHEFLPGSSKISNEETDHTLVDLSMGDTGQCIDIEANGKLGDSFAANSSRTASENGGDCLHGVYNSIAGEVHKNLEGTQCDIKFDHNEVIDHNTDDLILSQSGSIDTTAILPASLESRVFGVDRPTKLKEDDCAYVSGGTDTDSIRACSCSFCSKAAQIWLDLHHQDIKARMSGIKKSQKEASILAQRSCRSKLTETYGAESFTRVSNLESHLTYQWRSLFQHMADIWEEEGNQLEASLLSLTDLREKCKADLELINAKPSEKR